MECPNRNKFCVVCGLYVSLKKSRNITKTFVKSYEKYFLVNFPLKQWYVPEVACDYCYRCILGSTYTSKIPTPSSKKKPNQHPMKYVYPVIWMHRSEHSDKSCYFCKTQTFGFKYEMRKKINYHKCDSVKEAVLRSETNPIAPSEELQPEEESQCNEVESVWNGTNNEISSEYQPTYSEIGCSVPHFITQADFNDLMRDTNTSQRSAEIMASRLLQWRLVSDDFRVTSSRKRSNKRSFDQCFKVDDITGLTYATDIEQLFDTIGHPYLPEQWRLFIDGSVKSLKGVLLHIGNVYPSVPIIYGTDIEENYENMKQILKLINYDLHRWVICCDLKIVAIITGLKKGFSKHQCFLCLWEGRCRELHYTDHKWPPRITLQIGRDSIDHMPLVPSSKIILPPLHIKLGLIRNFVRALESEGLAMKFLKTMFPKLSDSKIDAGKQYGFNNLLKIKIIFFRCF